MHNTLRILLGLIIVCIISGCSRGGVKVGFEDKSYETDKMTVNARIPIISDGKSVEIDDAINAEYETLISELLSEFVKAAESCEEKAEFDVKTEVMTNSEKLLSVLTEIEAYTGGAHGNSFRIVKNINLQTGKNMLLGELFSDGGYEQMLNNRLEQLVSEDPDRYDGLWKKPQVSPWQGFYIRDGELVIYYPPYELSYYAKGFVEFEIPLEELKGYLVDTAL